MRQWLECVVEIHARQGTMQLAVLLAHALAVDDEQRRAELRDQPADLRAGERVDVCALCTRIARPGKQLVSRIGRAEKGRIVGNAHSRVMTFAKVRAE